MTAFKNLPSAERLRILQSEGGYAGWLREQQMARRGSAASAEPMSREGWVRCEVEVPPAVVGVLTQIAQALASGDESQRQAAVQALKDWPLAK